MLQKGNAQKKLDCHPLNSNQGKNRYFLKFRGILEFHFDGKDEWNNRCHVFVSNQWTGNLEETEGNFNIIRVMLKK